MINNDKEELREVYSEAWRKFNNNEPLEPLEKDLASVISEHPEFHEVIENLDKYKDASFPVDQGEVNPYLHLGLHIALREQVSTDRPTGIRDIHQTLTESLGTHEAEHSMMGCLANFIWRMYNEKHEFSEEEYLTELNTLIEK